MQIRVYDSVDNNQNQKRIKYLNVEYTEQDFPTLHSYFGAFSPNERTTAASDMMLTPDCSACGSVISDE